MSWHFHIDFDKTISALRSASQPLVIGVVAAMVAANIAPEVYHQVLVQPLLPGIWQGLTFHFLVNDVFMVFFFGLAAKEIKESFLPGGALSDWHSAMTPLLSTVGGVIGACFCFLGLNALLGQEAWARGWGIPTATDIALAWMLGRWIFGRDHPAVSFLLLLAVADDAIGLGIIAVAYPDPHHPVEPLQLLWVAAALLLATGLRRINIREWSLFIVLCGPLSWWGFHAAGLHPALSLVPIVAFIPGGVRDHGLFRKLLPEHQGGKEKRSPLESFQRVLQAPVDVGLFFFAFANAGVPLRGTTTLTWIVLASLILGKWLGVMGFAWVGCRLGFPLPRRVTFRHLSVVGFIAGVGLTVALFVANEAYTDNALEAAAKMGALLSILAALPALLTKKLCGIKN